MAFSSKSTCAIVSNTSSSSCLFSGTPFLLENTTDRHTIIIQTCFDSHFFSKINEVDFISRKTTDNICCDDKCQAFKKKLEFWKM